MPANDRWDLMWRLKVKKEEPCWRQDFFICQYLLVHADSRLYSFVKLTVGRIVEFLLLQDRWVTSWRVKEPWHTLWWSKIICNLPELKQTVARVLSYGELSNKVKLRRLFARKQGLCCMEVELYLGKKETDCSVKIRCIICVIFSSKCCFLYNFIIFCSSFMIITLHALKFNNPPCRKAV